jgi:glutaconate CoA-transferase subunit A
VLVTCERIVDGAELAAQPELTAIPAFRVDAVVEAPHGAWPASCAGYYDVDEAFIARYYQLAMEATPERLAAFVAELAPSRPAAAGARS